jgi:hypothetical protein
LLRRPASVHRRGIAKRLRKGRSLVTLRRRRWLCRLIGLRLVVLESLLRWLLGVLLRLARLVWLRQAVRLVWRRYSARVGGT